MAQRPVDTSHSQAPAQIGAFFDVDNTLIPGPATEIRFFQYLRRHGVVGWRDAARSAWYLDRKSVV